MRWRPLIVTAVVVALVAAGLTALLVNIFQRKQEARNPFYRVVELTDATEDPQVWGQNFRSSTTRTSARPIRCARASAAARRCRASRRRRTRDRWWRSRVSTRIRG